MIDQCHEVISRLEYHPSRLDKESIILEQAVLGNSEFFDGCKLALDSKITFGIKQVPEKRDEDGLGLSWNNFVSVANTFIDRTCTGNSARDAVIQLMNTATLEQWNNWYRRILIKDLRCGVSVKTINKVVAKNNDHKIYSVPVFTCQLAHDSANHATKVSGKKIIEVKMDGCRLITVAYPDGRVDHFSRNGKELNNFVKIKQQFSFAAKKLTKPMVFDGEVMSSSFQDMMKQLYRKDNVLADDSVLYLFDMMPLADFVNGKCNISQSQRSAYLKNWFEDKLFLQILNVKLVSQELVDIDTKEGYKRLLEINKNAIDGGYEGIMMKDPDAPYECKKTFAWLKLKPFIEVTLEVVGVYEGKDKNTGLLGGFICAGKDDGKYITVNVGGGFTDDNRSIFWQSRDEVIGQLIEVRADTISQNQDGTYSLRFPRFKSFRGFIPGEKL